MRLLRNIDRVLKYIQLNEISVDLFQLFNLFFFLIDQNLMSVFINSPFFNSFVNIL